MFIKIQNRLQNDFKIRVLSSFEVTTGHKDGKEDCKLPSFSYLLSYSALLLSLQREVQHCGLSLYHD